MSLAHSGDDSRVRGFVAGDDDLEAIREALQGLRYGSALITVQDGVIIQIDRTDRRRMRLNRGETRASKSA